MHGHSANHCFLFLTVTSTAFISNLKCVFTPFICLNQQRTFKCIDSFFQVILLFPLTGLDGGICNSTPESIIMQLFYDGQTENFLAFLVCPTCMHTFKEENVQSVICILETLESKKKKWPREQLKKKHDGKRSSANRRKKREWLMKNSKDKLKRKESVENKKSRKNLQSFNSRSVYLYDSNCVPCTKLLTCF